MLRIGIDDYAGFVMSRFWDSSLAVRALRKEGAKEPLGLTIIAAQEEVEKRHEARGGGCNVRLKSMTEEAAYDLVEAIWHRFSYDEASFDDIVTPYGFTPAEAKRYRLDRESAELLRDVHGPEAKRGDMLDDLKRMRRLLRYWQRQLDS